MSDSNSALAHGGQQVNPTSETVGDPSIEDFACLSDAVSGRDMGEENRLILELIGPFDHLIEVDMSAGSCGGHTHSIIQECDLHDEQSRFSKRRLSIE